MQRLDSERGPDDDVFGRHQHKYHQTRQIVEVQYGVGNLHLPRRPALGLQKQR